MSVRSWRDCPNLCSPARAHSSLSQPCGAGFSVKTENPEIMCIPSAEAVGSAPLSFP